MGVENPYQSPPTHDRTTLATGVDSAEVVWRILWTVPLASIAGGIAFEYSFECLEEILNLGVDILIVATWSGFAIGHFVALGCWMALWRLVSSSARLLGNLRVGDVGKVSLAGLVAAPFAFTIGYLLSQLMVETGVGMDLFFAIPGAVYFVFVLAVMQWVLERELLLRSSSTSSRRS